MQSDDVNVDATNNNRGGESASASPQRWKASIFFPVYPAHHKKDDLNELLSNPPVAMDICTFLNGGREREGNNRLYFSPLKYPPPSKDDSKERRKELFNVLHDDLREAAKDAASPITIFTVQQEKRSFCCHCSPCYAKWKSKAGSEPVESCPFRLSVNCDEHGYYISLGRLAGNAEHVGHPPQQNLNSKCPGYRGRGYTSPDCFKNTLNPLWNDIAEVHAALGSKESDTKLGRYLRDHLKSMREKLIEKEETKGATKRRKFEEVE
ncbi:hypothetical protein ACHAXT_003333 [Thalassiosira profunda]